LQWQRLPAGGNTWVNLTDQPPYSGTATAKLTVAAVNSAMTGDQFRCVISNSFGSVTSTPAGLIVALPCLIQTIAGTAGITGSMDGPAASATFNFINGIGADSDGDIYVSDTNNDTVRKITPAGIVSTIAGTAGVSGNTNNPVGTNALLNSPTGVSWDATTGNVYVLDSGNNNIRKISPTGAVSLLAGSSSGMSGYTDSPTGTAALFKSPADLSIDAAGNLYVADQGNNVIRMITPAGAVTTLAGSGAAGSADNTGTAASFNGPGGIGIDAAGNLYVADGGNNTIRKITMPGVVVTTIAGSPGAAGNADGLTGADARFNSPGDVQPDAFGNVYVIDCNNVTLREILASGPVITVAGDVGDSGSTDGVGAGALFVGPGSLILEPGGTLAIADTIGNTVRRATQLIAPSVQISPGAPTVLSPNSVVFTATVSGAPAPTIQWQRLPAGGTNWINLTNNATYSGTTTPTLTIIATTPAMNGDQFRCVISNAAGTATSAPAALTVQFPPQFTSAGTAAFVIGEPGAFTVTAAASPQASFSVTGLPVWAALDPGSGVLSGTPPNAVGAPFTVTVTASNGLAPATSQNLTLVVVAGQTFATWQAANFTPSQLANPTISGPTVVLGPDNSPNLLKYALGVAAFAAVPAGGQTVGANGANYSFTYLRPAAITDLIYTVQESTDLVNWTNVGVTQQVIATDATGMQTWQGLYTTTATAVFFRLMVTQP
jgi:sugar lactone lactonase YvrE